MTALRILGGLETLDLTGDDADAAARQGFLEWVFTQPGVATPKDAIEALKAPEAQHPQSDAAQAFVNFLQDATRPVIRGRVRSGRAQRLH